MAWDIFGTGKTSLKYNGGKYLVAANIGGIYSPPTPHGARSTRSSATGSTATSIALVDCDVMNFAPNGECTTFTNTFGDTTRFGS
jgi:hypothetical protein